MDMHSTPPNAPVSGDYGMVPGDEVVWDDSDRAMVLAVDATHVTVRFHRDGLVVNYRTGTDRLRKVSR